MMEGVAADQLEGGWMSTTEAARRLGITIRTLYRLIDEGQLVAYKVGRVIRLRPDDLAEFMDSARIEPGSLGHLYPDVVTTASESEDSAT
jgi:excisionase family DNA binding protein